MTDFLISYLSSAFIILAYMIVLWLFSLLIRNSSIVDIFWGAGFVLINWINFFALTPDGYFGRKIILGLIVTLWGLRLSLHILRRNWGKLEDFRYRQWREESGSNWWWISFFKVFLLQGFLMWVISIPLLAAQFSPEPANLTLIDILAVFVWGIGFFFETVGDWQLTRFVTNPSNKGKVLNTGVWRYTRHPNYFGDATQWWGYYILALSAGGWWAILSPALMTFLLRNVSGVTLLEKSMNSKPGYKEYIETTSAFFPWFPHHTG